MRESLVMVVGVLLPGLFLASGRSASGQEVELRQQAVQLLERANEVSTSPKLPNLERTVSFRAFNSADAQEGEFTRVVVQGTGLRDAFTFGNYHVVNIASEGHFATTRSQPVATPPEILLLMRLTPIYLVRFDHEDVIHSIFDSAVNGRALHCIQFETVHGQKSDDNQLCVDSANGTLVTYRLGNESIENSDFFAFAGSLIPGKISYAVGGLPKLEISQTMTVLNEVTPNVLAAPPNAHMWRNCTTFRRAFGQSMPQPKAGNGTGESEVVLRGVIGADGKVQGAIVQSSERPDLEPEALTLVQQWVFTPAMCDGKSSATEASFTLHFEGR